MTINTFSQITVSNIRCLKTMYEKNPMPGQTKFIMECASNKLKVHETNLFLKTTQQKKIIKNILKVFTH